MDRCAFGNRQLINEQTEITAKRSFDAGPTFQMSRHSGVIPPIKNFKSLKRFIFSPNTQCFRSLTVGSSKDDA